jgi:hypothetical protein
MGKRCERIMHTSSRTRRLERTFGFVLLIVLVRMSIDGIRLMSYAGEPFFQPQSDTSFIPAKQEPSPSLSVYHVPLRVHVGKSARRAAGFAKILDEINHIWWSQAGICFEMQVVMNDDVQSSGFDLWFVPKINNNDFLNGVFSSRHSIYVRDTPMLNASPRPAQHPAARTAAHELGHALNLPHRQDSDDNLMRSKTYGWQLNHREIAVARKAAEAQAIKNNSAFTCDPVQVESIGK